MNRRSFFLGASAGMALISNQAFAQRRESRSSILTSELTGGEIDASGSSLELRNQHLEAADGSEHFHFAVADGGQFDIIIWPQASGDAGAFMQSQADMYSAILGAVDTLGAETYDDGGWLAFDVGNIAYYEYQLGAYPGHDLVVLFNSAPESFADTFEQAQAVLIDGLPPFLFTDESDIVATVAEHAGATSSSNSRTSRASSTDGTGAPNPVGVVRNHRDTFLTSYDNFYEQLQIAADEMATDREVEDAFMATMNFAFEWQTYPEQAAKVQFISTLADLETIYLDWADAIGEMGFVYEDFYLGQATVDDFLAAHDEWALIDDDLLIILENLGVHQNRRITRHRTIARSMVNLEGVA